MKVGDAFFVATEVLPRMVVKEVIDRFIVVDLNGIEAKAMATDDGRVVFQTVSDEAYVTHESMMSAYFEFCGKAHQKVSEASNEMIRSIDHASKRLQEFFNADS